MSAKVAKKVLSVMKRVDYLQKDGKVAYGNTRYNYLSEEKITSEIRKGMAEAGLVIFPMKMEVVSENEVPTKSGKARLLNIVVNYRIQDTESDDFIDIQALGEGMDNGDKTVYKAMTGAFKYAQRQTFMIPTGDDPDQIASDELVGTKNQKATGAEKPDNKKSTGDEKAAAQNQLNKLFVVAKDAGMTSEQMKALIKGKYNKDSSKKLTVKEVSKLINLLENKKSV